METELKPEGPEREEPESQITDKCRACALNFISREVGGVVDLFDALMPADFVRHRRAARREALLAIRALIDAAIEHSEKEDEAAKPKVGKIAVD